MDEKTIDVVIQERIDGDTEFQSSLKDLKDEEKSPLIEAKRKELLEAEIKDLRTKAGESGKNKELADNYKVRAEKAETALKSIKPSPEGDKGLSTKDFYALTKANVPEEDIDDVAEYAAFRKIPIAEALKSTIVKNMLMEKAETRKTAHATSTRGTRPQNTTADGASILEDMRTKGEDAIPAPGSKEAEAAFWAKRGKKPQ